MCLGCRRWETNLGSYGAARAQIWGVSGASGSGWSGVGIVARKRCKVRRNTHFEHCIYCIGGADCQRCGEVAKLLSRACVGPQASACKCTRLGGLSTRGGMETEGTGGAGHRPRATDIPQFDFFSIWPAFLASPNAGFSTTACAGEGRWSYFRSGADMAAFCRVFMPAGRHGKPDSPPGGGDFFLTRGGG